MLKQTDSRQTSHKIRNHLTIIQNEVILSTPSSLEFTKKIVKNEVEIIKSLLKQI